MPKNTRGEKGPPPATRARHSRSDAHTTQELDVFSHTGNAHLPKLPPIVPLPPDRRHSAKRLFRHGVAGGQHMAWRRVTCTATRPRPTACTHVPCRPLEASMRMTSALRASRAAAVAEVTPICFISSFSLVRESRFRWQPARDLGQACVCLGDRIVGWGGGTIRSSNTP